MDIDVREARIEEADAVTGLLDAALLAFDRTAVRGATQRGDVIVAEGATRLCGALILDGAEITAIAVRPQYRRNGIGSRLISAAVPGRDRLVARFDTRHRTFYEANGFEIREDENGRLRGEFRPC